MSPACSNSTSTCKMNSLSLTVTVIVVLAAIVSPTVAQPWYSPCIAQSPRPEDKIIFKCPGHLRTEKLNPTFTPGCQDVADEWACHDDIPDMEGGFRRGQVTTACKYPARTTARRGGFCSTGRKKPCPRRFRESIDKSDYCKNVWGTNMTRYICSVY